MIMNPAHEHRSLLLYVIVAIAALATGLLLGSASQSPCASRILWPEHPAVPHPRSLLP
jgi:hypothetical protein